MSNETSVNQGTRNKATLKDRALDKFATSSEYGRNTLENYAAILGWDLDISTRIAMENYVRPALLKGFLEKIDATYVQPTPKLREWIVNSSGKPQPPTQDDKFVEETHDRVDPALTIVEKEIMAKQALAEYEKKQKVKKNAPADT